MTGSSRRTLSGILVLRLHLSLPFFLAHSRHDILWPSLIPLLNVHSLSLAWVTHKWAVHNVGLLWRQHAIGRITAVITSREFKQLCAPRFSCHFILVTSLVVLNRPLLLPLLLPLLWLRPSYSILRKRTMILQVRCLRFYNHHNSKLTHMREYFTLFGCGSHTQAGLSIAGSALVRATPKSASFAFPLGCW